jgi:hypothetical protein
MTDDEAREAPQGGRANDAGATIPPNQERRARLRRTTDRAATASNLTAGARDEVADERDRAADARDRVADERDRAADHREILADLQDVKAGESQRAANERDRMADERDAVADGRDPALDDSGQRAHPSYDRESAIRLVEQYPYPSVSPGREASPHD